MKFGPVALDDAEGAILAHAMQVGERRLRKSHRLTAADVLHLRASGVGEVIAAVLDPGDVIEDEAAGRLADALSVSGIDARTPATGRVNFHANTAGVFRVDRGLVDAVNRIDPAITVATLPDFSAVVSGQMVATVKIIPFAVPDRVLGRAEQAAVAGTAFSVHAFAPRRVALIQTVLPSVKASVLAKTAKVTAARLARSGSTVSREDRVAHDPQALSAALGIAVAASEMVIVFGASAMSDPHDVIPASIALAGGHVLAAGMPVDPGNLLVLGRLDGKPVLGAPGCARSPKENGFDWVLDRLIAGIEVTADDIAAMGVGGLLMEIPTRPQPRERPADIHAIMLAAGQSSRMGGPNKLLALFDGVPLVRRVAEVARASRVSGVSVVTGHQAHRVREALKGLDIRFIDNPDFTSGLASSLRRGIGAVPADAAGAMILLSDMPELSPSDLDRMLDAFRDGGGRAIVRASNGGKRGNPVILPREVFAEVARLEGDTGARHLVESGLCPVIDLDIGQAATLDIDTPQAMALSGGVLVDQT